MSDETVRRESRRYVACGNLMDPTLIVNLEGGKLSGSEIVSELNDLASGVDYWRRRAESSDEAFAKMAVLGCRLGKEVAYLEQRCRDLEERLREAREALERVPLAAAERVAAAGWRSRYAPDTRVYRVGTRSYWLRDLTE